MKGGHANSGPAPQIDALRRDRDKADWTHLPATGREGAAPDWPLTKPTQRELAHWAREWRRPQAVMWERLELEVEVAMYCRTLRAAEHPLAPTNVRTLLRQQQEALGLSVPGLARNRWLIDGGPEPKQVTTADDRDGASAKARFRTIEGGAAS